MKSLRRTEKKQTVIMAMRVCITPRCENPTPSLYCDECWRQHEAPSKTA